MEKAKKIKLFIGIFYLTAICLCRDHKMPIKVFNMQRPGSLFDNISGLSDGTLIQ